MPDFFLDRFISLDYSVEAFAGLIADVAARKGGSVDGIPQNDLRGGNAINVASALSILGANVTPIVCTSHYGLQQIKYHFKGTLDMSHIKVVDRASITTALEFQDSHGPSNVMLRDLGSLASFGPADLSNADYELIENSDYVCLFNWAGTLKFGTQLAVAVFDHAKRKGKAKTYYDTADPTPNKSALIGLMEQVLKNNFVDILSVNENEAVTFAGLLDSSFNSRIKEQDFADYALEAARILAKHLSARIDLHTTKFAATIRRNSEIVVPTFRIKALRATGSGDAWTAGNIIGDKYELSDEARLLLANAVAACYLSSPDASHPDKEKLNNFLKHNT